MERGPGGRRRRSLQSCTSTRSPAMQAAPARPLLRTAIPPLHHPAACSHLCRRSNIRRQMYSLGMLGKHLQGAAQRVRSTARFCTHRRHLLRVRQPSLRSPGLLAFRLPDSHCCRRCCCCLLPLPPSPPPSLPTHLENTFLRPMRKRPFSTFPSFVTYLVRARERQPAWPKQLHLLAGQGPVRSCTCQSPGSARQCRPQHTGSDTTLRGKGGVTAQHLCSTCTAGCS